MGKLLDTLLRRFYFFLKEIKHMNSGFPSVRILFGVLNNPYCAGMRDSLQIFILLSSFFNLQLFWFQ